MNWIVLFVTFFALAQPSFAQSAEEAPPASGERLIIRSIEYEGLRRTKTRVLEREFEFEIDQPTTRRELEETVQRLRNLHLFSIVEYELEPLEDGYHLKFLVLERWTILPVFKGSSGGGVNQLIIGLYDINVLGRYLEMGAQYERLGPTNSGVVWFRDPRLFDQRLWFGADIWHINRIYTLYDKDGEVEGGYLLNRNLLSVAIEKEWKWWLKAGLRLQLVNDETSYDLLDSDVRQKQVQRGLPDEELRIQPGINFSLGRLNYDNYRVDGLMLNLRFDGSDTTLGSSMSFASAESDFFFAKTLPFKSTLALRWLVGVSSTESEPHYYFIGGFDRVRGFVDARFRGPAHTTANLEYRIPSLDTSWVVLQHVVFADATSVGQGISDFTEITAASAGAGLRVISPRIFRLTLRLDYAVSLVNNGDSSLSFGVQQFF